MTEGKGLWRIAFELPADPALPILEALEESALSVSIFELETDADQATTRWRVELLREARPKDAVLDRELAERRIWPAIDVRSSGTRHEEKLFEPGVLDAVVQLHRMLANSKDTIDAAESFIKLLKKTPNNAAFLEQIIARTRATV